MPYSVENKAYYGGHGWNAYLKIQTIYPNHVIFVSDGVNYRVYGESANRVCDICNISQNYTSSHGFAVLVQKNDAVFYKLFLGLSHVSYIFVNSDSISIHSFTESGPLPRKPETPTDNSMPRIKDTSGVTLENDEETFDVILLKNGLSILSEITLADGRKEMINIPVTSTDGRVILSGETPLYQALLGRHKNEQISYNGMNYLIVDVS